MIVILVVPLSAFQREFNDIVVDYFFFFFSSITLSLSLRIEPVLLALRIIKPAKHFPVHTQGSNKKNYIHSSVMEK